jgi:NTP pyrophosphatase (non-canonical NTP hydrolase)
MKINEIRDEVHELARSKGWWDDCIDPDWGTHYVSHQRIAVALALIHSEVSEALEEVRDDHLQTYWVRKSMEDRIFSETAEKAEAIAAGYKPEGLPIELADVIIRVLDLCGALEIDIEQAIEDKVAYNTTRTHRHGGRKL